MNPSKFLSPEWMQETSKILQNKITPESTNSASLGVALTVENLPGGGEKTLLFEMDKGKMKTFKQVDAAAVKTEFALSGDYRLFEKVFKGQVDPMKAVMGGDLKFKGNMLKAMSLLPALQPFFKVLSGIPTQF